MKIAVIVGSTRDSRVTARLAKWVQTQAEAQLSNHEVTTLDIKSYDLPFLNEDPWNPDRPLTDGMKAWLTDMKDADGYVFVTAEHNHGMPAALKNAIDLTNKELHHKPAAIVSHGVVSGARAQEQLRLVLNSEVGVIPVPLGVTFYGMVNTTVNEDGSLVEGAEQNNEKLTKVLGELDWLLTKLAD